MFPSFTLSPSRLLPPPARLLCGESRQSVGVRGRGSAAEAALTLLDAPGCSWSVLLFSHLWNMRRLCIFLGKYNLIVFSFSVYFFLCLFNLSSEGRQGTSVVSCNRMVPAGVSHVCPQRLLSDTVRALSPLSICYVWYVSVSSVSNDNALCLEMLHFD